MPTVIIYWSPGRTSEQKAAVVHEVTEALVRAGNARREDVLIIFQEIQPGDSARGGVITAAPTTESTPIAPSD